MRRLEATGTYTDDEINRLARGGKQRWHIPGVGRVLPARATASPSTPANESTLNSLHKKVDFMMSLFKSDSKYSYVFSQFESGGASESGGCGDEEEGADHQDDEDEDGDGDTYMIDVVFDISESNMESMQVRGKFAEFSNDKGSVVKVKIVEKYGVEICGVKRNNGHNEKTKVLEMMFMVDMDDVLGLFR
nr:F-box domain, leucine-rich repeat domain, L domain-like protein [Tanacetum cinerariifolium]